MVWEAPFQIVALLKTRRSSSTGSPQEMKIMVVMIIREANLGIDLFIIIQSVIRDGLVVKSTLYLVCGLQCLHGFTYIKNHESYPDKKENNDHCYKDIDKNRSFTGFRITMTYKQLKGKHKHNADKCQKDQGCHRWCRF
jgi:hypothetical protein